MTTRLPTQADPRERILRATLEFLSEHGFQEVTVRAVAGRAGVSTATFYKHFESLQQCLASLLDLGLERAGELIGEAFAQIHRSTELARAIRAGQSSRFVPATSALAPAPQDSLQDETRRAAMRAAGGRRALECLYFLEGHPGASNTELARALGVAHKSQISRLLLGLQRRELVAKRVEGPGKRNRWRLTEGGEAVVAVVTR